MQKNEIAILPVTPTYVRDLWGLLKSLAAGKSVLNVGAAGNVEFYMDGRRELWMHEMLKSTAAELVGLDIDEESVAFANARGEALRVGSCETVQLGRQFDLIVLSEVIEHVNLPVTAVGNLMGHLKSGGKLFITTPNPTHYGTVLRALLNLPVNVYYDHVTSYFPENLVVICQRLGLRVSGIYFFNTFDTRTKSSKIKSIIARCIGTIIHRFSSNFIFIIEKD